MSRARSTRDVCITLDLLTFTRTAVVRSSRPSLCCLAMCLVPVYSRRASSGGCRSWRMAHRHSGTVTGGMGCAVDHSVDARHRLQVSIHHRHARSHQAIGRLRRLQGNGSSVEDCKYTKKNLQQLKISKRREQDLSTKRNKVAHSAIKQHSSSERGPEDPGRPKSGALCIRRRKPYGL